MVMKKLKNLHWTTQSKSTPVIGGILQYTVSGPLLFVTYINNLLNGIRSRWTLIR